MRQEVTKVEFTDKDREALLADVRSQIQQNAAYGFTGGLLNRVAEYLEGIGRKVASPLVNGEQAGSNPAPLTKLIQWQDCVYEKDCCTIGNLCPKHLDRHSRACGSSEGKKCDVCDWNLGVTKR